MNHLNPRLSVLSFPVAQAPRLDVPITRGGRLSIEYDPERLTTCRRNDQGAVIWNIEAFVRFNPGGRTVSGTSLEEVRSPPDRGLVISHKPVAVIVDIPMDTREIEIWFHSFASGHGGECEAWDSDYGRNYRFAVDGPASST
jgi:hypothetical protein